MPSKSVLHSTIWSISQRYLPSVIHIIATLIITRMITPSDFGEVALITTFYQISILLVSSGLGEGLIFKVDCSKELVSSVFYFNILIALVLYSILFFTAPYISNYYGIERLNILTKIIGLNIIVYALSYVQRVLLQKAIDFKKLAIISLAASIISSVVGLILAYKGWGIWSIVFLTLLLNFIEFVLLWCISKWKPSFVFSWNEILQILPYSVKILLTNCVQVIYDNIYSLTIGKTLDSKSLGYFNRMQTVVYYTTTNFMYSIENVFFSILCKNRNNESQLRNAYVKLLRITMFITSFVLVILIGLKREIVIIVLTDKWIDGASVLMYLAIGFMFQPISYINNSFLKIFNKTKILLCSNILKKIIGLFILCLTLKTHSLTVICYGVILYYFVDAIISMVCTHRFINISLSRQFSCIKNVFVLSILSLLSLYTITSILINEYLIVLVGVLSVFAIYFFVCVLFKTDEYVIVKNIVSNMVAKD